MPAFLQNFALPIVVVVIGAGVAVLIWASLIERHWYAVRRATLAVLPAGAKSIRVLHIGDVHLAPWQKRKMRWISALAALEPDLVIDTGDNLGHSAAIEPLLKSFEPLLKTAGAFVNGSNDYYAPKPRNPLNYLRAPSKRTSNTRLDTEALTSGFKSAGWLDLNNSGGALLVKGTRIGFIGVDDAHDGLDDLGSLPGSASRVGDVDLLLGVSHAPYLKVIEAMGEQKVSLLLAGHTHGGQVCLPAFGAIITNCDLPRKYAKGLSAWNVKGHNLILNVVAGLGHSIYAPVRLACRPEVRLLELVAR